MKYFNVFMRYIDELEKYAKKSNREYGCMFIEFDDKDLPEIRRLFLEVLDSESKEQYETDGIPFYGDEPGLFYISPDCIRKDDRVVVSYKMISNNYDTHLKNVKRNCARTEKQVQKALSRNEEGKIHKFFTPSPFKRYIFTNENFNMAFRLKKSKWQKQPVVVYFHGGGNGGNNNKALNEFRLPYLKMMNKKCTIIIPQSPYNISLEDYILGIKELIEIIAKEVDADKNRIYVFGGSAGGRCTWQMAYDYPDFIACALPLSGELYELNKNKNVDLSNMKKLPMWISHSADDYILPIENDDCAVKKLNEMGAPIKYSRYENCGHGLKMAYRFYLGEKWVDWMFNQSLENR